MSDEKITNSTLYFGKSKKVFNISTLKTYLKNNQIVDAKKYILTFFAKSSNGQQIFFYEPDDNDNFNISTIDNIKSLVYKSLETKLQVDIINNWFEKEVDMRFKINSDPRASMFYQNKNTEQNYINLSNGFLHKEVKSYESFDEKIKIGVEFILKHIKDIWNSKNEEQYNYCLNWLSMSLTGHKMDTALFLKSGEGAGKSIIVLFLIKYVIGEALGLITSRCSQLLHFNSQILGKILLCLEELPTASNKEWHTVADYLKDLITGHKLDVEKKYQDTVQVINLISLIIITNNENTIKFGKDARR